MRIKTKKIAYLFVAVIFTIITASRVFAQNDVAGSKDHPLISRFSGSVIKNYDVKEFDEYVLPLGKLEERKLIKSQKLEGKVTQIVYGAPKDRSILEIHRNYELALKKAGFEILFTGAGTELGEGWLDVVQGPKFPRASFGLKGEKEFHRYLSGKLSRPEGYVYVAIYISSAWDPEQPAIRLDVIEVKPMETGLVEVNAEAMAKDIEITGHSSIYGIYFDTGKAEVNPKSEAALVEIAKLLGLDPKLNLYVVGHTDNVGTLASNMNLSKLRAEAVVKVLISKYRIAVDRLTAAGVGPLSPVVANKIEEGRAKNRRVELVKQ